MQQLELLVPQLTSGPSVWLSWTHLQQQQVLWDPLHRLKEQIVEGGFAVVTRDVALKRETTVNQGVKGSWRQSV